jgi:hypothetical protein
MATRGHDTYTILPVFDVFFFFFSVHSCLEELFSKEYYSSKVI